MPASVQLFVRDYPPNVQQPAHSHDELHFSLILRGGVAESVAGRTACAGPLALVAKDAGVVHADHWGRTGCRIARLSFQSETLAALTDTAAQCDGWRWTHNPSTARPFLRIVARSRRGEESLDSADADILDVLAAFTARQATEPRGRAPAWLRDVTERAVNEWHPTMTGADVASWAQVHPVYLARCVRRWYGVGLSDMLRIQRRRATIAAVTNTTRHLSAVALDHGYADESHCCRDISRALGLSPGRLRSLIGSV
jgi:AraC family transcriptional regulator